jgi:hypothetical protein
MAEGLFLVRRTTQGVNDDRNRVREVLINEDDGQTDAQIITATIAALNAAQPVTSDGQGDVIYPAGYFDTVVDIDDLVTSGPLRTDGDFIAFAPRVVAVET